MFSIFRVKNHVQYMEFELSVKQETQSCENRHLFMLLSNCDETKGVDRPKNITGMRGVTGTYQMM